MTENRHNPPYTKVPEGWQDVLEAYDFARAADRCKEVDFRWYGMKSSVTAEELRSCAIALIMNFNRASPHAATGGMVVVWTDDERAIVTCMNEPERFKQLRGFLPKPFTRRRAHKSAKPPAPKSGAVHMVLESSQPYVTILCRNLESSVYAGQDTSELPEGVLESNNGLYTFDTPKVTCKNCLMQLKMRAARGS